MNPRYADYIRLNRNVLCAVAASMALSAAAAQALDAEQDHLNATYVLAVDSAVYFSVFGALHYASNRRRYVGADGRMDRAALKSDLLKTASSLGVAEVAYTAVRWLIHYNLLAAAGSEPYAASAVSQAVATAVYLVVLNLGVTATRLYGRRGGDSPCGGGNGAKRRGEAAHG